MTAKEMMKNNAQDQCRVGEQSVQRYTPAVDIYDSGEQMVLVADMPGVAEDDLELEVVDRVLTLEGRFTNGEQASAYYRQFKLSEQIDAGAGEASLSDGVLTLKLPKVEAARPKKIEVKTLH